MSHYDPSSRIPASNMYAYTRSTPKAPLELEAAAEFSKGKPAIVQIAKNNAYYIGRLKQHLDDFDKDLAEWKASGEWKKDYKSWGLACEVALGMTRQWADRLIKRHNETGSTQVETTVSASSDTDKKETLAKINALPSDEELLGLAPRVHAGAAPMPKHDIPEPKAAPKPVAEHKPRERNDNGKPIWAMPVWREVEDGCGKLINRADALNQLVPNKEKHHRLRAALHSAFDEIQSWHELARNHHA
jgi:hypothetical protein